MDAQFEHLCRICAANTKSKTNSVVESVFIFKTQGLRDKISRHLYLNVVEDDPLPKVLCKSCYRQVEATASLSNIAKHTQLVFRDFLLSTLPKNAREAAAAQLNAPPAPKPTARVEEPQPEVDEFRPIKLTRIPETTITTVPKPQAGNPPQRDEVSKAREASLAGAGPSNLAGKSNQASSRRSSVFVDSRFGSAPMSIAQRSMQHPPSLVPLHSEVSISCPTKSSPEKKPSPAGVINFIQTHGRITGNVSVTSKEESPRGGTRTEAPVPGMPNLPSNVVQQKRRNLKNAVNNIKAINSGQVSLLKTSQNRNPVEDVRPLVTTTVVPHQNLFGAEPSVEEALPEHMIFAAPKKKRDDEDVIEQTGPPKLKKIGASPTKPLPITLDLTSSSSGQQSSAPSNVKSLTEAISLGSVIRDPDLLKLILKALKWPVSAGNCEEQMNRLKGSKFAVIMSDSNLLQDTDLTQLLGPYLAPMLALAQQQDKLSSMQPSPAPKEVLNLADLSKAMPYKLPPETSVQLVPSSPTEQELPPLLTGGKAVSLLPVKRPQRNAKRARDLPPGDRSSSMTPSAASTSNAAHVTNELLNLNAMLLSQFGASPADALNEALISLLKQQQESKEQRNTRRRSSVVNLEDIVLVEPQPPLEANDLGATDLAEPAPLIPTPPPLQAQAPPVTRPIIKRRKTVIQSSKSPEVVVVPNKGESSSSKKPTASQESIPVESEKSDPQEEPPSVEPPSEPSQAPTSTVPEATNQANNSSENTEEQLEAVTDPAPENPASGDGDESKAGPPNTRKSEVKAALGQKLLEAIGLPQGGKDVAPESSRDTLRSALKRSLKQAQEQQQQLKRVKQEEPVKQQADSTTKPSAAESADERKKAIAERELALLKRKAAEDSKLTVKDERPDVSSSSSRNRNRNRRFKAEATAEDSGDEEKKSERWDEDDELPLKADGEKAPPERSGSSNSNRPTRASKTLSKYYKGPSLKSQHAMGTRSTRQR
ncbi:hypothetical protein KR009_008428 [Drosophila setifemur]|nr:hypothetical protein KR009_008428 [Drosophila setifemur]